MDRSAITTRDLAARLGSLRDAHRVLAHELTATQRRLHARDRERSALRRALRAVPGR